MKKSEIAMVILIGSVSLLISYLIMNKLFGNPKNESVNVKTIERISTNIQEPNPNVFNKEAINPTVEITIGK